ncbi:MAG: lamin tail domain-containing protein [Candidatus Aureabacteria bacterium]|nr:lamin tail domain-containing protein [Candidatus Auribacterota bacterium]
MKTSKLLRICVLMFPFVTLCSWLYSQGQTPERPEQLQPYENIILGNCDNLHGWVDANDITTHNTDIGVSQNLWLKAELSCGWTNDFGVDRVKDEADYYMGIWIYDPDGLLVTSIEEDAWNVKNGEIVDIETSCRPVKTGWYTALSYYLCDARMIYPCDYDWDSGEMDDDAKIYFTVKDSDHDGLTDSDEINVYGTDPYKYDSDYDWLSDGREVYYNGKPDYNPDVEDTNAKKWDTDGDGYCDGHEVSLGRNPLNAASKPGQAAVDVSINEILYDWPGADIGHEFIELYNKQSYAVNLSGYYIQASAAGGFKTIVGIPAGKVIGAGSYFLIGGTEVKDVNGKLPDIVANITMQNSDNPGKPYGTDGVRLVKPGGYVLDTVLYGQPNCSLFGDNSCPGQTDELCPDVAAGHSLSRKVAGVDTNKELDWVDLATPNPTSSASTDSDNDGLSNVDEASWGTNPLDPDTDKDGYIDGSEVSAGTNPKSAASRPRIVINEIYYDPPGADEVKKQEFIEIYNPESSPVNMSRCAVQYGGAGFGTGGVGFLEGTVIPAKSFYLIGDSNVQSTFGVTPNLVRGLQMQNGDQNDPAVPYYGKASPTDGVHLVGYRGKVLDTVLYDSPNDSKLQGDASNPAGVNELCPDVQPGHSLSRKTAGVDTNNKNDWKEAVPSPKL